MKRAGAAYAEASARLSKAEQQVAEQPERRARPGQCSAIGCPMPGARAIGHGAPWFCSWHFGQEGERFALTTKALCEHMPLVARFRRELIDSPIAAYATSREINAAVLAYLNANASEPARPRLRDLVQPALQPTTEE